MRQVPRGDQLLDWAMQVMRLHAERKSVLEVEFIDEEGTGLGPTLEFYALVAAEMQRSDLAMWIVDDTDVDNVVRDIGSGEKPAGYYVSRPGGLFPSPMPQDSPACSAVSGLFWTLGVFLAKTLQDNRLMDLPLSTPFLKLLCQGEVSHSVKAERPVVSSSPDMLEDIMTSSTNNIMTSSTNNIMTSSTNNIMTNSMLSVVSEESEASSEIGSQVTQDRTFHYYFTVEPFITSLQ